MPLCKNCGNTHGFGSSKVESAAQFANGPVSGIMGDFDGNDNILQITSMGAAKSTVAAASHNPRDYFDVCLRCGSQDISWTENNG
jgi:hypothetical protein